MNKRLLIVLGLALAFRIFLMLTLNTYEHPVAWEYENIANNILHGKGFIYESFLGTPYKSLTTPLYVFLCVGVYAVTGHSYIAILLIQSIFSLCLAMVIFQIARHMFGEKVAFLSALLTAFHPGFVYYDVFNLIPLSMDSLFITSAAWLLMGSKDRPTVLSMSCVGCMIGLGAITRGIIGTLLPFLSLYFILFTKRPVREKIGYVMILWAAAFVVIAPWVMRNFIIHKELVYISSTSGENLYRGNNLTASGTSLTADGRSVRELWPKEVTNKIATLDELGQKKFFEKEAVAFIKNNPAVFAKLYLKKMYYFWWFSPQSGVIYSKPYLLVYKLFYSPVLAFALFGAALALVLGNKAMKDDTWLLIFVSMAICLTQSLFYVEGRHRWLVEPFLMIFFSYGITEMCGFLIKKTRPFFAG